MVVNHWCRIITDQYQHLSLITVSSCYSLYLSSVDINICANFFYSLWTSVLLSWTFTLYIYILTVNELQFNPNRSILVWSYGKKHAKQPEEMPFSPPLLLFLDSLCNTYVALQDLFMKNNNLDLTCILWETRQISTTGHWDDPPESFAGSGWSVNY